MTEQNSEMSTPFTEVVTNKIKKQDEKIANIEAKLNSMPDTAQEITDFKKQLTEVKVAITAIKFPIKQMEELSGNLVTSVTLLKQPVENKVLHHHHVHKIVILSAALIVLLGLALCGWYNTGQKLDQYQANDFKYRYLKLSNNVALHKLLVITDSLYQTNPEFGKAVLHGEDSIRNLIQQMVNAKEQEVSDLKRKMK
jgi:hypothetical protein